MLQDPRISDRNHQVSYIFENQIQIFWIILKQHIYSSYAALNANLELQAELSYFRPFEGCRLLLPYGIPSLIIRLLSVFG
jgi:hypothetical protein